MGIATPAGRRPVHRHPVNVAFIDDAPRGARIADRGNTEILKRIENFEHLILELQTKTLDRLPARG